MDHVLTALLDQSHILLGIGIIQRLAGNNLGAAAVHLQGADGRGQDRYMGLEA